MSDTEEGLEETKIINRNTQNEHMIGISPHIFKYPNRLKEFKSLEIFDPNKIMPLNANNALKKRIKISNEMIANSPDGKWVTRDDVTVHTASEWFRWKCKCIGVDTSALNSCIIFAKSNHSLDELLEIYTKLYNAIVRVNNQIVFMKKYKHYCSLNKTPREIEEIIDKELKDKNIHADYILTLINDISKS
jgi:hypothetical protein